MKLIVVIPCYNEEQNIKRTTSEILKVLENIKSIGKISEYEMTYVDDGSTDMTWSIIEELSCNVVHGLKLSHNVGHQNALWAGYEYAQDKCDIVVSIDADLQQDPNAISKMLDEFSKGNEVVYGIRNNRSTDNLFKKLSSLSFYRIVRLLGVDILPNHADYRLLSNRACKTLVSYPECNIFIRGLVRNMGFQESVVYFDVRERIGGKSKYSTSKMVNLAIDGITSFSTKPLRLITILGIIIIIMSICAAIYIFTSYTLGVSVPGWSSILLSVWFLGGVLALILGVIGEYVGKIYKEVKRRPKYHIDRRI